MNSITRWLSQAQSADGRNHHPRQRSAPNRWLSQRSDGRNHQNWRSRLPAIAGITAFAMGLGTGASFSLWSSAKSVPSLTANTGHLGVTVHRGDAIWLRSTYGYHSESRMNKRFTATLTGIPRPLGGDVLNNENPWGCLTGDCPPLATQAQQGFSTFALVDDDDLSFRPDALNASHTPTNPLNPVNPLVTMPGDSFDYCLPVTSTLMGTNLAAGFKLLLSDPVVAHAVTDEELAVEFYLATPRELETYGPCQELDRLSPPEGQPMAKAVVDVVAMPAMVADGDPVPYCDDNAECSFTVIVRVTVLGDYKWESTFNTSANTAYWDGTTSYPCPTTDDAEKVCTRPKGKWSAEQVDITLIQIRNNPDTPAPVTPEDEE